MLTSTAVRKQLHAELDALRKQVVSHSQQDVRQAGRQGSAHAEGSVLQLECGLPAGTEFEETLQQVRQIRKELTAWQEKRMAKRELADWALDREQLKCENEVISMVLQGHREESSSTHDSDLRVRLCSQFTSSCVSALRCAAQEVSPQALFVGPMPSGCRFEHQRKQNCHSP
jgi:hypothetical protein